MGVSVHPEPDPTLRLQYYRETGQSALADQYARYLTETGQMPAASRPAPTGHAGTPFVNAPELAQQHRGTPFVDPEAEPSYTQRALGGIASLAKGIPGAEVLQAGTRSVVRGQPYREALNDIRGAEQASGGVGTANAMIGRGLTAAALQKLPVLSSNTTRGALQGALEGFTDADPDADRRQETVTGGVIGGALGATADLVGAAGSRGLRALSGQAAKEKAAARGLLTLVRGNASNADATQEAILNSVRQIEPLPAPVAPELAAAPAAPVATPAAAPSAVATPAPPAGVGGQLSSLLAKLRAAQPHEIGATYGDAEEAMGLAPHQQPDLEDLLRRSLAAKAPPVPTPAPATVVRGGVMQPAKSLEDLLRESIIARGGVPHG